MVAGVAGVALVALVALVAGVATAVPKTSLTTVATTRKTTEPVMMTSSDIGNKNESNKPTTIARRCHKSHHQQH